ncbi:c-type cytochrome [Tabrizicola sp. M-4]|uniref:c-type cytochrome n=1 Tax=Tabrizicola sp. M-4 TaxID=3055847 RepID=UPI003DA96666
MSRLPKLLLGSCALVLTSLPVAAEPFGLGRAALPEEIAAWDVAILPDGQGLKPGSGDVLTGEEVFAESCASCHGEFAEGLDSWPVLAGGEGTLTDPRPVKTIGSYWPHLSTVWDYVHRSMPFGSAQTMSVDDTYAITAFLLYSNGLVEDDFVLTHENFTEIVLPNADGFYPDDRPATEYTLFKGEPCMADCIEGAPEVTKRAIDLNVTPEDPDGRPAGSLPDLRVAALGAGEMTETAAPAEPEAAEAEVEVATAEEAATAAPEPEEAVAVVADPALIAAGEKAFKKCAACHKVGDGAKNATGPHLNGVVDRVAGMVDGFKYSKPLTEMAAAGLVWDAASLSAFLENPKGFMKGTKMTFAGLKKPEERDAIIAYLATFAE